MKKILFILPALTIGGMEREQVTIANKLACNGYDVTVMTLSPGEELRPELDSRVYFIYKQPKKHLGNYIRPIRHRFYDDGMWETRASAKQLHDYYVGDEHYDVEIAFFRGLPVKIVSSAPKTVRTIAWVHSDFEKAWGYQSNFKSLQEVKEAYKSFDKVVCVSKQARDGFQKVIGDTGNLTTIYNMLPIKEILAKAEEKPMAQYKKAGFNVVIVARLLDSVKGIKRLIDAIADIHNSGKDISLLIIGTGLDEQMLQDEISDCKADDYINIIAAQINPYPYIKESDLLVCSSYYEGYNLTVAEALIIGTPVLSTDCTGPNEILDHGKYGLIVENSEEGLRSGVERMMDNPELLQYYKDITKERREFFDEEKIFNQIDELF